MIIELECDLDYLSEELVVMGIDDYEDLNLQISNINVDIDLDESDENYQEEYDKAYQEAYDKNMYNLYNEWKDALESELASLFRKFYVDINIENNKLIADIEDIDKTLAELRNCINGYGLFYIGTIKEWLDIGPYEDKREIFRTHWRWVFKNREVYGYR